MCRFVQQGLGVEGEGGEGCVTRGAGGSQLPGLPFRNVCSRHAPWAASGALRCRAGSVHRSPKVHWALPSSRKPAWPWGGQLSPQKARPGDQRVDFSLSLDFSLSAEQ